MLFGDKLELYKSDICSRWYFSSDWDCNYKNTGGTHRGQKIHYPIRCNLIVKQDIGN